ncbi:UDP-N-acetylmuramoyl-tripeptide--D-alanyl-D-alanine ligase (D-alanyl-D-alanine-adding enzyme) (UDP-MurNAc-pentapeptide synthetase) [Durusdinium trenchii]|uniref:UDP-MurNAc-pentapeptide synthetase n=1 Tax=Durusdinium trenchii TaxID=1381693 RepID=A0ABP0SJI4_9DINO
MAEAASAADHCIVTSDNPRNEDPCRIIDDVMAGFLQGASVEAIVDRRSALATAFSLAEQADCVIVAGKGHERVQVVESQRLPFDDVAVCHELLVVSYRDLIDAIDGKTLLGRRHTVGSVGLAEHYRRQFDTLVIGVTGSVGKTTTRRMIHAALGANFCGIQSPYNYNNHIGLPLSLLQLDGNDEFAVLELGASRVGEIADLADIAQPEMGVLTAIRPAHLDEFGSIENIVRAKSELLEALPPSGVAVLNGDDDRVREAAHAARCTVTMVGEREDNDLVAHWIRMENGSLRFCVDENEYEVPAIGRHHLTAALAAIAIAREVGMRPNEIADGLRMFEPAPGRCHLQRIGPWSIIDDTYNANPSSVQAACRVLNDWQGARKKILVLGDMLCLGDESEAFHREIGEFAARSGIEQMSAVGSQAAVVTGSAREAGMDAGCLGACRDLDTAMMLLDCWIEPGDVILVKGSRGMRMERVVEQLREIAARLSTLEPRRHVA